MSHAVRVAVAVAVVLVLLPIDTFAQEGQIAGTVRDPSNAVIPGVTVEVTSPALIGTRSTTTDANGQYRITNLPVGTYVITFTLQGFARQQRDNIVLTTGFTAPVNATMAVGDLTETVVVTGEAPTVDVQNARQAITFSGDDLTELPTGRNLNSLLALTPGITHPYSPGTLQGTCPGGAGVFCNPGIQGFNVGDAEGANMAQGRILVDGQVVNAGASLPIVGMAGGYTADIANAQEVSIQLSGALGESETGGASINIVPRTGGNRYAGNYNTTYTRNSWFGDNSGSYPNINLQNLIVRDHDVSGAFGGPILRDRFWFYAIGRTQGKEQIPCCGEFFPNLHEGVWGYNYQGNRGLENVRYTNQWANGSVRFTLQATTLNKFNIFWDEQDFCQDPCGGVVSVFTSPESWWSVQSRPNRLQQISWTNPLSNRILLEAGLSITAQHYRTDMHREYANPRHIPRIAEVGLTAGADSVTASDGRTGLNNVAGSSGFAALTSGSLNAAIGGGAETRNSDNYRMRASASYVTGSHNAKFGYEGAVYTQATRNQANDLRMTYNYVWPSAACPANPAACGNTHLGNPAMGIPPQFPDDPNNLARRPIPNNVQINTGPVTLHDRVQYSAFYLQDQWTIRRLTLNGALRYDHASSRYGSSCVGPDIYVPIQTGGAYHGQNFYCTPETPGVSFHDISPRWGAAYDLFGTGRTALKFNMGKYLQQASISGAAANVFSNSNPARRSVNILQRNWTDTNGDRIVNCDLMNFEPNGECGAFSGGATDTLRFGRDPFSLDEEGSLIGLNITQCGLTFGVRPDVQEYCNAYGDSLIEGWGKRRTEWHLGIGVQHELLPRLSVEVTYNRRMYSNLLASDQLNVGCDRFLGEIDMRECQLGYLNYMHPDYDFFSIVAPEDGRLPGGGGYTILGLNTPARSFGMNPTAQTLMPDLNYNWNGVDTNFVWRGPYGIRLNGGTSTGRTQRDQCFNVLDGPEVKGRVGNEYRDGCRQVNPFQTRVNGTVAYVIPWVDVLVSGVFQGFRGTQRSANLVVDKADVIWSPESQHRATEPCANPANGVGCLGATRNSTSTTINLLDFGDLYGERVTLFDLKVAKNIRFARRRATIGADIYNAFNSDAINTYNNTYNLEDPNNPGGNWGLPAGLVPPRFVRLSLQFQF